jgi:hypothetical protein
LAEAEKLLSSLESVLLGATLQGLGVVDVTPNLNHNLSDWLELDGGGGALGDGASHSLRFRLLTLSG